MHRASVLDFPYLRFRFRITQVDRLRFCYIISNDSTVPFFGTEYKPTYTRRVFVQMRAELESKYHKNLSVFL